MFKYLAQIWRSKDLRNKILFTIGGLIIFRITTQISIPGANLTAIRSIFQQNSFLGIFSALTGGSAENFSIVLMGVSPYINASIIIQLLTVIIPKLEAMSKEGEQGQKTLNKYTRWLTLPLAFLQSYGTILLLNSQSQIPIIDNIKDPSVIIPVMLTITAGTLWLMWLGEIITEKGMARNIFNNLYKYRCRNAADSRPKFISRTNGSFGNCPFNKQLTFHHNFVGYNRACDGSGTKNTYNVCGSSVPGTRRTVNVARTHKSSGHDPYYLCGFSCKFSGAFIPISDQSKSGMA